MAPHELLSRINADQPVCILDVRSTSEFRAGHIPGAIPFRSANRIATAHLRLPERYRRDLCGHGPRAYIAGSAERLGFTHVEYLKGHMKKWET